MSDGSVDESEIDGRTLRGMRTKSAIIDARLALMLDGNLQPTAAEVADEAGVSLRSLWTHFSSYQELLRGVGDRVLALQYEEHVAISIDLPLSERVERFCHQRVVMMEAIAPVSRAAQTRLPFSAQLRENRAKFHVRVREEIEELFAQELNAVADERDALLHSLLMASIWPTWMGLRDEVGLSCEAAEVAMTWSVRSLLERTAGSTA